MQTQLAVTGQRPVTFALETNIINLPYANYKKIANFFEEGQEYDLNVYFETRSEYVNASHFRIDQLTTEEEIEKDSSAVVDKLVDAIIEKIKVVREYKKPEKKTETKAKTTKSTTKKKTTTKKNTTTKKK